MPLRIFYSLLLIVLCTAAWAQTDTIQYFDEAGNFAHKENAAYYRKVYQGKNDDGSRLFVINEFWTNGTKKTEGSSLDPDFAIRTGKLTTWYKNGNKKTEGRYYSSFEKKTYNWKTGKWKSWYYSGKPMDEWSYSISPDFTAREELLVNFWDSTGTQLVTKGTGQYYYMADKVPLLDTALPVIISGSVVNGKNTGKWEGRFLNGKTYFVEQYLNGQLIIGKSFDLNNKEYTYTETEQGAIFPGGDTALLGFLVRNIQYPALEREAEIQGKVVLQIIIDKNGGISNAAVSRSVSPGLDAEAIRVVKLLPPFIPGKIRGQSVARGYSVPVRFNLE